MRNWKSYSMAAVFVALYSFSLVGCDPSATVADILADILSGGSGCGGCGGCGSCDCASCDCGCDCSGCDDCGSCDCNIGCDPTLREHPTRAEFNAGTPGRAQGFHGPNVHPNRRIGNAVQLRLGSSGYTFLEQQIPGIITSALGTGGFPIPGDFGPGGMSPGKVYIELRQFSLDPAINCTSPNPQWPGNHDCIRATMYAYFRSCDNNGACNAAENVPISIAVNQLGIGTVNCILNLDAGRGSSTNGLRITAADVTTVGEIAGFAARANFSRLAVLDAQVDQNTLEGADVQVSCPRLQLNLLTWTAVAAAGALISGLDTSCYTEGCGFICVNYFCDLDPTGIVQNTMNQLRADINGIIDYQLQDKMPKLCQAAYRDRDCPTGTTYAAPATAGQPGSCTINGQNRCMELLLGMEGRVDIGGAVAMVTPGIEALIDFLGALQGHGRTFNAGSNAFMYLGLEGWLADNVMYAGLRAFPHNPCVAIEHPADSQADCNAVGSGWEYEVLPNAGHAGRCVPRIPVIPESDALKQNAPIVINATSRDGDFEVAGGFSESFIQYAGWKLWDSGALCLGVGSWLDPTLAPSLISFAFLTGESKQKLFFPLSVDGNIDPYANPSQADTRSSIALALRPQRPPVVTLEEVDDPCEPGLDKRLQIDVQMDRLDLDLSIWGQDRWARGGTIETDTHIVVQLDIGNQTSSVAGCRNMDYGDIDLAITTIAFENSRFLPDSPNLSAAEFRRDPFTNLLPVEGGMRTISSLAGGIATPLLGGLASLNIETTVNDLLLAPNPSLPIAVPVGLALDPDAIQMVDQNNAPCSGPPYDVGTRGTDNNCTYSYLAFYGDLVPASQAHVSPPMPLRGAVETTVQVTNVTRPGNSPSYDLQSPSFGEGETPMVEFRMGATGPANAEFEYRYRTTLSGWSEWGRSNYGVIRDRSLFVQGRHEVYAQARVAGDDDSRDRQSARAPFVIDVTPPMMEVYEGAGGSGAQLHTMDLVSGHLQYRTQEPGDDFTAWANVPSNGIVNLDVDSGTVIEVKDEDGNVASNVSSLQGRTSSATSSACGSCATVGSDSTRGSGLALVSMAALGALVVRRRRRA